MGRSGSVGQLSDDDKEKKNYGKGKSSSEKAYVGTSSLLKQNVMN